jgi:hypothetical protein
MSSIPHEFKQVPNEQFKKLVESFCQHGGRMVDNEIEDRQSVLLTAKMYDWDSGELMAVIDRLNQSIWANPKLFNENRQQSS